MAGLSCGCHKLEAVTGVHWAPHSGQAKNGWLELGLVEKKSSLYTVQQMHIHACPVHVHAQVQILGSHAHSNTGAYTLAPHAYTYAGGMFMCIPFTYVHIHSPRLNMSTHVGTHMVQGSAHICCFILISLPSTCGFYHLLVYLQGIDRSHSWVNSAYAPGGSKAVLRRAPPYCGADPRQVPSLPAPARM